MKDALEGMVNGKKVRGRRRYQMIDNIMINGLYADTKMKAEKRVEWRMLLLQCKTATPPFLTPCVGFGAPTTTG